MPLVWFITRHPGARHWAQRHGIAVDYWLTHLEDLECMQGLAIASGDTVMGTLPVNLAAEVCALGAHYLHLYLKLPAEARGRELSADELEAFGACLKPYRVLPIPLAPVFSW